MCYTAITDRHRRRTIWQLGATTRRPANWPHEGPNVPFTRQTCLSFRRLPSMYLSTTKPRIHPLTQRSIRSRHEWSMRPHRPPKAAPSSQKCLKAAAGSSAVSASAEPSTRKRRKLEGMTVNSRARTTLNHMHDASKSERHRSRCRAIIAEFGGRTAAVWVIAWWYFCPTSANEHTGLPRSRN